MIIVPAKRGKRSTFKKRLVFFGKNSNIHGLKNVVNENSSIINKIFWIAVLLSSGICLYFLLVPVLMRNTRVNFVPNTLYLDWDTTFPAVTVCEDHNVYRPVLKKLTEYYEIINDLDYMKKKYLADNMFGKGTCSKSVCEPCGQDIPCDFPWREAIDRVRYRCEEILRGCSFNDKEFPCCRVFGIVDSETGPCYAFNSFHNQTGYELFKVNRTTGPGVLKFFINIEALVFLHSPEDLATKYNPGGQVLKLRTSDAVTEYIFSVVETESSAVFKAEYIKERDCRYPQEVNMNQPDYRYKTYSYGACRLAIETDEYYEKCGCVHPVRDLSYKKEYCNMTGINCWALHRADMLKISTESSSTNQHNITCLSSCVENELKTINIYTNFKRADTKHGGNLVILRMVDLPTIRFRRTLFRTDLDVVVSIGGMAGLFFGASILSVAETFYLLFRR